MTDPEVAEPTERHFAVYDGATGRIRSFDTRPADDEHGPYVPAGFSALELAGRVTIADPFVDVSGPPIVTARPEMPATLNGLTITGVPLGATLRIEGVDYAVGDGAAELSFTLPGAYTVKLSCWPYLDKIFEVVSA